MLSKLLIALLAVMVSSPLLAVSSGVSTHPHIQVELISETESVAPGQPFRVALKLTPDEHWHTYWKNPGDSGLATALQWSVPDGFEVSEIHWPWPEPLPVGPLLNYGYSGVHALAVTITPPAGLMGGGAAPIKLQADWLVCKVECVPGQAELTLTLPVQNQLPQKVQDHSDIFTWIDARQPVQQSWPARFSTQAERFSLLIETPSSWQGQDLFMFPANNSMVDHAAEVSIIRQDGQLLISQALSDYFVENPASLEVVLVDAAASQAVTIQAVPDALVSLAPDGSNSASSGDFVWALLFALAGGVLLNLMPCVFPVLSLKALNLVAGGDHQRAHGLAFTAGVVLSFIALAGLLLLLRAGGEAIGWGFQLQSPWFVGLLAYLLFVMGLSLSGFAEFGARWMGVGQSLTERDGLSGSFFTGVLACVVASPCTAPFMGSALGFAISQPAPLAIGVFAALGFGLALPMLLLSLWPGLGRWLPRPGAWMERFKQALAFPLYLTVVWLVWVLARQVGINALAAVLSGLVVLASALWLLSFRALPVLRYLLAMCLLGVALALLHWANGQSYLKPADPIQTTAESQPWSASTLDRLRQEQREVFVNLTADWCITCLANERVALSSETVRAHMATRNIVYLKGDWTRRDAAITDYLASFGRNGVPLYVYYAPGEEPRVLPQILTPSLVVEALQPRSQ